MGWLGWSEPQALAADVNSVILALEAKREMLAACYGDGKPKGKKRRGKPSSADFRKFAAQNNRRLKGGE